MDDRSTTVVDRAKEAALRVLLHNAHGPFHGLPRTAGWGYPEPYTRDLMLSALGILVTGNQVLTDALRRTLNALAVHQSPLGHIPSLANDPNDRGASDSTPLFLLGLALFRQSEYEPAFLEEAARKALTWMQYQSPDDMVMVSQLPTSDWRDEQWVLGYGLFVNTLVYGYLMLFGEHESAARLRALVNRFEVVGDVRDPHVHEGLVMPSRPYYALYSYKMYNSDRFDLLGNSLAILTGIASRERSRNMIAWVEAECQTMRGTGDLVVNLPPCLFPFILRGDPDWRPRYELFNRPGDYHNGGVWPFVCGVYIAACVAAGRMGLARRNLVALAELVKPWHENEAEWGFNEWIKAQSGQPSGRDWQTWSAAMYLYAAECVRQERTPFFEEMRHSNRATVKDPGVGAVSR
ncbi:glycoside hydrolase 100 family protein [uncultured Paludibaculum sp.]|uniref:glycoside hydrolase 100 family protein n=1 Tax=uncultured Paludibaculum sp. TaxID=1765020 RepID=UPI002AAB5BE8|nr:glycoside hydrolase 100 family protein [uncultured Paludibaculum sp.]